MRWVPNWWFWKVLTEKSAQDTEYRVKNKEDKLINKTSGAIELP